MTYLQWIDFEVATTSKAKRLMSRLRWLPYSHRYSIRRRSLELLKYDGKRCKDFGEIELPGEPRRNMEIPPSFYTEVG